MNVPELFFEMDGVVMAKTGNKGHNPLDIHLREIYKAEGIRTLSGGDWN